jgi:hypothetical protein
MPRDSAFHLRFVGAGEPIRLTPLTWQGEDGCGAILTGQRERNQLAGGPSHQGPDGIVSLCHDQGFHRAVQRVPPFLRQRNRSEDIVVHLGQG